MTRWSLACTAGLCIALGLSACTTTPLRVDFGGAPLVSGQTPASQSSKSEPQVPDSLPPGAAGLGGGPTATSPDIASVTVSRQH